MNKQRFLAELRRLLVFMSEEDRDLTVRFYTQLFEEAGPDWEEALLAHLGTPTKVAIGMSRGYEPGAADDQCRKIRAQWEEARGETLPDLPDFDDGPELPLPPVLDEEAEAPAGEEDEDLLFPDSELQADPDTEPPSPSSRREKGPIVRPVPLALGLPLFIVGMAAVGLPLACLTVACLPVLLSVGCGAVVAAGLTAIGALWCVGYLADALLLFGLAFVMFAAALCLLWGGLWCCVKLVGLYLRFVRRFAWDVLGKRED